MTLARPLRTASALLGTASLVALLSIAATPAAAADAPWTTPVEITDAYGDAEATVVAPDGTITVLTESADGIVSASSTDGGLTWGAPVTLGTGGDYAFRPAIGVTESGLLAAAWVEEDGPVRSIQVAISDDGGATWGTPAALPTVEDYVDDPVVASASATGFTVVWNESFTKLSSSSTDSGATWGAAQVITQNMNSYNKASMAATGSGDLAVVFQEFDGMAAQYSIQSRVSTDGGATWGSKVPVGESWSGGFGNGLYSYALAPAEGTVVAVWGRGTSGGEAVFATTSTDGGASWEPQFGVGSEAGSLRYFSVETVSPTTVGVLWHDQTMDAATLHYATVTVDAGEASPPVTVATVDQFGYDYRPAFSALGDVRVASWLQYTEESAIARASVSCDAGATWSAPALLASGSELAEQEAQTTVSGGVFTAYWGQDASGSSGRSLFAASLTDACGAVVPPGPALAATGSSLAPTVGVAAAIVALGAGMLVMRRRAQA